MVYKTVYSGYIFIKGGWECISHGVKRIYVIESLDGCNIVIDRCLYRGLAIHQLLASKPQGKRAPHLGDI